MVIRKIKKEKKNEMLEVETVKYKKIDLEIKGDVEDIDISDLTKIQITTTALEKIHSYTEAVDTEVAGLLLVDRSSGIPLIKDALIYEQEATMGGVELDMDAVCNELTNLKDKKNLEFVKGWWHSHVDMDVYWSGTDDECFENLLSISNLVYGIVVNKQGENLMRIDMKTDLGVIRFKDIPLETVVPIDQKYVREARSKVNPPSLIKDTEKMIKGIAKTVKDWIIPDVKLTKRQRKEKDWWEEQ